LTLVFLAALAVAWIAVILPALLRARQTTPLSAAERFKRRMQLIAPKPARGRWVVVPESRNRLAKASLKRGQRRRIRILVWLLAVVGLSAVAALINGGLWEAHLLADASLTVYCALLLEAKKRRLERLTKVRPLRRREPEYVRFFEPVQARRI
jgi:hypothetical protein